MGKPVEKLLVPVMTAARQLGIGRDTIKKYIADGRLKHVKMGNRLYIPQSELQRILSSGLPEKPIPAPDPVPAIKLDPPEVSRQVKTDWQKIEGEHLSAAERWGALVESDAPLKVRWEAFQEFMAEGCSEDAELEQDIRAGIASALAVKRAQDRLETIPFRWVGPGTAISPERRKATEDYREALRSWRESRKAAQVKEARGFVAPSRGNGALAASRALLKSHCEVDDGFSGNCVKTDTLLPLTRPHSRADSR